jgi:hypothetical protein
MAKAINWPLAFREEVLTEDTSTLRCALRLGTLYFDNRYWVPDEVVDIRVNHLKIRPASVVGDLKSCAIKDLTADDRAALKRDLSSTEAVIDFLKNTYQQSVDENTVVTVVYYKNHEIDPETLEQVDDPHA